MEALNPILKDLRNLLPAQFDSNLFSLNEEVIVPKDVCEFLLNFGSQVEELVGRDKSNELRVLNFERMSKQAEHRHKADEEKVRKLEAEISEAQSLISELKKEKESENESFSLIKRELESTKADATLAQGRFERAELEKMELVRVLERKQSEMDNLNEQIEATIKRQTQARQDLLNREEELENLRRQLSSIQVEMISAQQQGDTLRKQSEWATSELERSLEEFKEYRKQKMEELARLRGELEQAQGEMLLIQKHSAQMKVQLEEKDSKIEHLIEELFKVKEMSAEEQKEFVQEASTKNRLAEVYRQASEEAATRVGELEELLGEREELIRQLEERLESIEERNNSTLGDLQDTLNEKNQLIESLKRQTSLDTTLSGTASAAIQLAKSGQSLGDVYTELTSTRTSLLELTQENSRLKTCLRDICEDIEARLPSIQGEREENAQLKSTVSSLSERLFKLANEKEHIEQQYSVILKERSQLQQQVQVLEQQVKDLSHQVQSLLLDTAGIPEPTNGVIDSQQVITNRLVAVKNVTELQVRNQELLRVVRDLSSRLEKAEQQSNISVGELQKQLDSALIEINQLKEARTKQASLVESLVASKENSIPNAVSSTVEMMDLTKEDSNNNHILIEDLRSEIVTVKTNLAKAQAKADFTQERLDLLRSNYESTRQELEQTRQNSSEQSKTCLKLQTEMQSLLSDVLSSKEQARKAETELSLLKATLTSIQTNERRLIGERDALQDEKQRLASLLSGLQAMVSESEASSVAIRDRLTSQISFLERELHAARMKIEESVEAHRLETGALGRENRELHERINNLYEELNKQRQTNSTTAVVKETNEKFDDSQYRALSEANAKSLLEVSRAYDQYRVEAEDRLNELESVMKQSKDYFEQEKNKFDEERSKFVEYREKLEQRLTDLTDIENMLKEHEGMRAEDLARLSNLLTETQSKLEAEMSQHQADLGALEQASHQLRQAQLEIDNLKSSLELANSKASIQQSELIEKIDDYEVRNEKQFERISELEGQLKGFGSFSVTGSNEIGENEIVNLLRKQKDSLQNELSLIQQDRRRLQAQLDQTQRLLEEERAHLMEAESSSSWRTEFANEITSFQTKIAELTALKDSYNILMLQKTTAEQRASESEGKFVDLMKNFEQICLEFRESKASQIVLEEQIQFLTTERDKLKSAVTSGSSVDDSKLKELEEERDDLVSKLEIVEKKLSNLLKHSSLLQAKNVELNKKLTDLTSSTPALNGELQDAQRQIDDLTGKLAKYQEVFKRSVAMRDAYTALQQTHSELQEGQKRKVEELKKEHDMHKTLLTSQFQTRINNLQNQIAQLQREEEPSRKLPRLDSTPHSMQETSAAPITAVLEPVQEIEEEEQHDEELVVDGGDIDELMNFESVVDEDHEMQNAEIVENTDDGAEEEEEVYNMEDDEEEDATAQEEELQQQEESHDVPVVQPSVPVEPVISAAPSPTAELDFDIDQFLVDTTELTKDHVEVEVKPAPIIEPAKIIPTTRVVNTSSALSPTRPTTRTIILPTSSSSGSSATTANVTTPGTTPSTFTPTPTITKGRIIDLSQTGRKPLPTTSSNTTATTASATIINATAKPTTTSSFFKGRGGLRGRGKKFKRGGGGGGQGNQPAN